MSSFHLEIALVGDAFTPEPGPELTRLVRRVADKLGEPGVASGAILDLNGNRVGTYWLEDSEERTDA